MPARAPTINCSSLLQQHLGEYEHHQFVGSVPRLLNELKAGKKVCTTLLKTPARERFAYYSIPTDCDAPQGVTILRAKAGLFGDLQSLSLKNLLDNTQLRLGIQSGRSYGKTIDAILKRHAGQKTCLYPRGQKTSGRSAENAALGSCGLHPGLPHRNPLSGHQAGNRRPNIEHPPAGACGVLFQRIYRLCQNRVGPPHHR